MVGKKVKSLENLASDMELNEGFSRLERGEYDRAIEFFTPRLDKNYMAYYGLATALFRKEADFGNFNDSKRVVSLYKISIQLNPSFADSYLMLGLVQEREALALINKIRKVKQAKKTEESQRCLGELNYAIEESRKMLTKAREVKPEYLKIVGVELENVKRLMEAYVKLAS